MKQEGLMGGDNREEHRGNMRGIGNTEKKIENPYGNLVLVKHPNKTHKEVFKCSYSTSRGQCLPRHHKLSNKMPSSMYV